VAQKWFSDNSKLVEWYGKRVQEWKNNKIMKLFRDMRNVSSKEHTPETFTLAASSGKFDTSKAVVKISSDGRRTQVWIPIVPSVKKTTKANDDALKTSVVIFGKLPPWFEGSPDVMHLCERYLHELEGFVAEAEKKMSEQTP
jgi:hypothetical protein